MRNKILVLILLVLFSTGCVGKELPKTDSDGDGLSDEQELKVGTDPHNKDTDGDGYWDVNDSNPLDENIPVPRTTILPAAQPSMNPNLTASRERYIELWDQFQIEFRNYQIYIYDEDYDNARKSAMRGRNVTSEILVEIGKLKSSATTKNETDLLSVDELTILGNDDVLRHGLKRIEALEMTDGTSEAAFYKKIAESLYPLQDSLYRSYKRKKYYPQYWDEDSKRVFDKNADIYEKINQQINKYYDRQGNYNYKYYLQINPDDPVIIEIADNLTYGMTDKDEIKWTLLKYVRNNVNYKYDPQWQTDWVRPPAYTLVKGWGDCDDIAILLHSLYLRSGINSKFAIVDTDGDGKADHATVVVGNAVWDPTCSDCVDSAPDGFESWRILSKARDIDEYIHLIF